MKPKRLGKQSPRYSFFLNPYSDVRFTSCPKCRKRTRQRKLPLVIHVDPFNPVAINKTCRYCPTCDLLIAHKDEIEQQLSLLFARHDFTLIGNDYLVIGTQDRATAGALVDVLHRQQMFYELPGFLALAGDAQAIVPLLQTIIRVPDDDGYDLAMALTAVAHRIGREALVAELDKTVPAEQSREVSQTRADQILQRPASTAEAHFALFYRGLTPEDLAQAMGQ